MRIVAAMTLIAFASLRVSAELNQSTAAIVMEGPTISSGQLVLDIRHQSFAGGAICDGTNRHDIGPALQAAINALPPHGGEILIPGSPSACWLANPESIVWKSGVNYFVQGNLSVGTTLTIPDGIQMNIIGGSAGGPVQFQAPGQTGVIGLGGILNGGAGTGTLGTATPATTGSISSGSCSLSIDDATQPFTNGQTILVNSATSGGSGYLTTVIQSGAGTNTLTISPCATATAVKGSWIGSVVTFTPSTMSGLTANAAITIAGNLTCTPTSVTRTGNRATATFPGPCHISAGSAVTVAGMSDTSFNGAHTPGVNIASTPFLTQTSDYVQNTLTWNNTGPDATTSGGTVTGLNEDSVENEQLTSCTTDTCTANFWHAHASTDAWGVVVVNVASGDFSTLLQDLSISGGGTALWLNISYETRLKRVGVNGNGSCTFPGLGVDLNLATVVYMDEVAINGCAPYELRMSSNYWYSQGGGGPVYMTNSWVASGVKIERTVQGFTGDHVVFEKAWRAAVTVDPTHFYQGTPQFVFLSNSGMQDSTGTACMVNFTQPATKGLAAGSVEIRNPNLVHKCLINDYYAGQYLGTLKTDSSGSFDRNTSRGVPGTYNDGKVIEAEVRGEQAPMSPALIPYSTVNVNTNPASWTQGTCRVTTGQLAPDGSSTAGSVTGGSSAIITVGNAAVTPAVGDFVLAGGWVYSPTHGVRAIGNGYAFQLDNNSSTHYSFSGANIFGMLSSSRWDAQIVDDWWHPVVMIAQVSSSDGTANQHVRLNLPCGGSSTLNYWMPFMIYVPASAGYSLAEMFRWRAQLLHGVVPPGMPSGGGILAVNPAHKLYWGRDTNLYRGAAGVLQTDGSLNIAASGAYQVGGTQIRTGNLGDWTNVGRSNGNVPMWNATTGKWTPGIPGGAGTVTGTGKAGRLTEWARGGTGIQDSPISDKAGALTTTVPITLSGLPNGCVQLPCVVATVAPATYSGTAGISPTTFYTTLAAHQYQACLYQDVTVAATMGSVKLEVLATSDEHRGSALQTSNISMTTQWDQSSICGSFYADAGSAIKYQLFMTGSPTGTPTVRYAVVLTQLQ